MTFLKIKLLIPVALLVVVQSLCLAGGTTSTHLQFAGSWPFGDAAAIALDSERDLVFLGSGGAVLVLDVGDPTNPVLLSDTIRTRGFVQELAYDPARELLFIAADRGGFEIWHIESGAFPERLSQIEVEFFDAETPVISVAFWEDHAYVACEWGYVHWINVSDPSNPVVEGYNGLGGMPSRDVCVADGNAFVAGPSFQHFVIEANGSLLTGGNRYLSCVTVYVSGDEAYVGHSGSLYILDLQGYGFPTLSATSLGGVLDTCVDGNMAYVGTEDGFYVLDVTSPASPQVMSLTDTGDDALQVAAAGGLAYVACGSNGLYIYDVTDPAAPVELGSYDTFFIAWDAQIHGDVAYIAAHEDGLLIVDASESVNTTLIGQHDTPGEAHDLKVAHNIAYLADWTGGLRIVDVSDPAATVELGALETFDAWRVELSEEGHFAYLIDGVDRLKVIDVSDPTDPVETASIQTVDLAWELDISGDFLFVANHDGGVRIFDVSDPANPFQAGHYNAPWVWDLRVRGDYAYVASTNWIGGFLILDVSDPTAPTLVSKYNPSGWFHPYHVEVNGDFAYVSHAEELYLFDISDPANPVERDDVELPEEIGCLTSHGTEIYAIEQTAGVLIYKNALKDPALQADTTQLSAATGGQVEFILDGGTEHATRNYLLLAGQSGTVPGTLKPGGHATIPLNRDWFTDFVLANLNGAFFVDFYGNLNGAGQGAATLDTLGPFSTYFIGRTLHFAWAAIAPLDFASNAVAVDVVP